MKGILFKPWKIKAIADSPLDKEWQTRRIIKPQPKKGTVRVIKSCAPNIWQSRWIVDARGLYPDSHPTDMLGDLHKSRYQPNEVVYIKEAHHFHQTATEIIDGVKHPIVFYKARDTILSTSQWRNPRTMPAWAARYHIRITDVRAERLQEITEEDAIAEGSQVATTLNGKQVQAVWTERQAFKNIWDSINGKGSWDRNDWVWVYSFKRAEV